METEFPPGPPGPPSHRHEDGTRCMWVRRGGIDSWRMVDETGWDLGSCPRCRAVRDEDGAP